MVVSLKLRYPVLPMSHFGVTAAGNSRLLGMERRSVVIVGTCGNSTRHFQDEAARVSQAHIRALVNKRTRARSSESGWAIPYGTHLPHFQLLRLRLSLCLSYRIDYMRQ